MAGRIVEVREATTDEDTRHATDYVVTVGSGDIACRVRDWDSWLKHGDLTIRSRRPSGAKTELAKIKEGFGRWYLYAWVAKDESAIDAWMFVDLDKLRETDLLHSFRHQKWNRDRSSAFVCIFPTQLIEHSCLTDAGGKAAVRFGKWKEFGIIKTQCAWPEFHLDIIGRMV